MDWGERLQNVILTVLAGSHLRTREMTGSGLHKQWSKWYHLRGMQNELGVASVDFRGHGGMETHQNRGCRWDWHGESRKHDPRACLTAQKQIPAEAVREVPLKGGTPVWRGVALRDWERARSSVQEEDPAARGEVRRAPESLGG